MKLWRCLPRLLLWWPIFDEKYSGIFFRWVQIVYYKWCFVFDTCISTCYVFTVGEYRLSREDGAHYQGVPHPRQPLGSVLQPVSRTHGNLHTGTSDKHWISHALCYEVLVMNEVLLFCFFFFNHAKNTHLVVHSCLFNLKARLTCACWIIILIMFMFCCPL